MMQKQMTIQAQAFLFVYQGLGWGCLFALGIISATFSGSGQLVVLIRIVCCVHHRLILDNQRLLSTRYLCRLKRNPVHKQRMLHPLSYGFGILRTEFIVVLIRFPNQRTHRG